MNLEELQRTVEAGNLDYLLDCLTDNNFNPNIMFTFNRTETDLLGNTEITGTFEESLLHRVIFRGGKDLTKYYQAIELLISRGANLNFYDDGEQETSFASLCDFSPEISPPMWLYEVAIRKDPSILSHIPNQDYRKSPLTQAASCFNFELVRTLIKHGAKDYAPQGIEYRSALDFCFEVAWDYVDFVDDNSQDFQNFYNTVECLLEHGQPKDAYKVMYSNLLDAPASIIETPRFIETYNLFLKYQIDTIFVCNTAEPGLISDALDGLPENSTIKQNIISCIHVHSTFSELFNNRNEKISYVSFCDALDLKIDDSPWLIKTINTIFKHQMNSIFNCPDRFKRLDTSLNKLPVDSKIKNNILHFKSQYLGFINKSDIHKCVARFFSAKDLVNSSMTSRNDIIELAIAKAQNSVLAHRR